MKTTKKNLIFDLDGTLWNAIHPCVVGWNKALSELGCDDLLITDDDLMSMVGHSQLQIFAKLFPNLNIKQIENLRVLCDKYQAEAIRELGGTCYVGVMETLKQLQADEKKIFIVSNCESGYIELFLAQTKLDFVLDFECWGNTGLSKCENINLVVGRNHLDKNNCIYIGDTQGDCDAASKAEMDFIYANYGFGKIAANDFHEINAIGEIFSILSNFDEKVTG